jgi:feruloyl esterase
MKSQPFVLPPFVLAVLASASPSMAAATCESLASLALPETTITLAQSVPAGGFTPPATARGPAMPYADLPPFCRVAATVKPTSDSNIKIEVWLPVDGWNGKFNAIGTGGWAGAIGYPQLRDALRRGYATSSTDTGHTGGSGTFALEHPEQYVDFGYRSQHEMTVKAKAIITAFYASGPRFSYWDGCSSGGRMGLQEAQRFPNDFQGIVAGAPANFWSHMNASMIWIAQAVHKDEASYIPATKYSLIHQAVIDACDTLDGVKDGILEDPSRCKFDPGVLTCKAGDAPTCLTAAQVETARTIYAPAVNPRTKQVIYPGLAPGSELGWALLAGPRPLGSPVEFFQNVVFKDRNWDYKTFNFDSDVTRAEQADNGIGDATNADLKPYFSHGGKLLQYHGWSDQALASQYSVDYYERVAKKAGGVRQVQGAYRLFMVPGMGHCTGGEGTSTFDMLGALEQWVEHGNAPDRISASRVTSGTVVRTRPLCPYPQVAAYKGSGSTDDAANFVCQAPKN